LAGRAPRRLAAATGWALLLLGCARPGEDSTEAPDTVEAHVAAARTAAGEEHAALFERICTQSAGPQMVGPSIAPDVPDSLPSASPDRPGWYAEPHRVFDDLYWVGQTRYSAWALTTSDGIVIIDPLFEYSVEAAIADGLTRLGLDPSMIRYVIVSHGHRDHVGGARYLQDEFGARVVMAPEDWDLIERSGGDWPKPVRDIEAFDGYEILLGGATLTLYATPGHTPGTMSTVFSVRDGDATHVAALWGGTAFNFLGGDDEARWFREYVASAERFADLAEAADVEVLLSNHPQYDGSTTKLPALARRALGEPHPYVIGSASVERYLRVAAECARVGLVGDA
jgi:metallo-beta-lactamase class B